MLLVVAHGVGARELDGMDPAAHRLGPVTTITLPPDPIGELLHGGDATNELHDLGVAVDRSALVLRPAGRTDATVVARLGERATGPAPVTLLEWFDVLEAAAIGGAAATTAAMARARDLLTTSHERLRRGDAPETWFVGLGSAMPVHTTFDFGRAWNERIVPPLARELHVRVRPDVVTIHGDNRRSLDLAADWLDRSPFARIGTLAAAGPSRLRFFANDGIAFGDRRMAARTTNARSTVGVVAAPASRSALHGSDAFGTLLARFWMRAAELHVPEVDEATPLPTATGATPRRDAERTSLASSSS